MRQNSSGRRSRGRSNNNGGNNQNRRGNNRSQVFDSNGPDVRIRGTAHQVQEKYLALAKDAASVGDVVLAESYLQHAEHYQRMINVWNAEDAEIQERRVLREVSGDDDESQNAPQAKTSVDDDLGLPASMIQPVKIEDTELQDA